MISTTAQIDNEKKKVEKEKKKKKRRKRKRKRHITSRGLKKDSRRWRRL